MKSVILILILLLCLSGCSFAMNGIPDDRAQYQPDLGPTCGDAITAFSVDAAVALASTIWMAMLSKKTKNFNEELRASMSVGGSVLFSLSAIFGGMHISNVCEGV